METEQAKFEGWAIVEMMGHQREIGYVTTEAYGVAVLFRVDVPDMPECEFVLRRPEYGDTPDGGSRYLPVGSKVRRAALAARSRLISPAAVYAINPCTEEAAKAAILSSAERKLICLELPAERRVLEAVGSAEKEWCEFCEGDEVDGHREHCPNSREDAG